jgi:hypothetical protein
LACYCHECCSRLSCCCLASVFIIDILPLIAR